MSPARGRDLHYLSRDQVDEIKCNDEVLQDLGKDVSAWFQESSTQQALHEASNSGDVDLLWGLINEDIICKVTFIAPVRESTQFPAENTEISHLLAKRWQVR